MKAYDFEYDGIKLSEKGFMICSFDSKGVETISNGSVISFNMVPTLNGFKHNLMSAVYEDCLETTIQICKYSCSEGIKEISSVEFREMTRWLSRKKFLKFKILDEDYIDLYFEATFNISRIEIDGRLYGLELEVMTNRPFALKEPRTINIKTQTAYCWEKFDDDNNKLGYVTSNVGSTYPDNNELHTDGYQYTYIGEVYVGSINDTSHEEGFIYPFTEITMLEDGDLKIHNFSENRDTYIADCKENEVITMDYPVVWSSNSSHDVQNDFNWNFFRVANTFENSRNDLIIFTPCEIKIRYSPIVKVGL